MGTPLVLERQALLKLNLQVQTKCGPEGFSGGVCSRWNYTSDGLETEQYDAGKRRWQRALSRDENAQQTTGQCKRTDETFNREKLFETVP